MTVGSEWLIKELDYNKTLSAKFLLHLKKRWCTGLDSFQGFNNNIFKMCINIKYLFRHLRKCFILKKSNFNMTHKWNERVFWQNVQYSKGVSFKYLLLLINETKAFYSSFNLRNNQLNIWLQHDLESLSTSGEGGALDWASQWRTGNKLPVTLQQGNSVNV